MSAKIFNFNLISVGLEAVARQENDKDMESDEDSNTDGPLLDLEFK